MRGLAYAIFYKISRRWIFLILFTGMIPMRKKILVLAAAAGLLLAAGFLYRRFSSAMGYAEVRRKLQGLRMAVEIFRQARGRPPADMEEVLRSGGLEAAPELKLKGHPASSAVRNSAGPGVSDTGAWGYVSDPKSADFGLVFIDCTHRDEKNRPWSDY
jgi:hypothetical protein